MHYLDREGRPCGLDLVTEEAPGPPGFLRSALGAELSVLETTARAHFAAAAPRRERRRMPSLPLLRDTASGRLRTVYREIVVRFRPGVDTAVRRSILRRAQLSIRRTNQFVDRQCVLYDPRRRRVGLDLLDAANALAELAEVSFAVPNFVTEYRRPTSAILPAQWHLRNDARAAGQRAGEDVNAVAAWQITRGRPSVVVAIIDDGVDVDHPNLKPRIWRNPDAADPDRRGRDFFLSDDDPGTFDPRPKIFQFPFDLTEINDIHGTACAGVVAATGRDGWGIAPRSRILPVKVFHADQMASDERVADAIRYSATKAAVLSCSWTGAQSPDLEEALIDAGSLGRGGAGSPVFCAAGNDAAASVAFPASDPNAVAVGASTDQGKLATYSNRGPELSVVAPSGGGIEGIYTTDVAAVGRGYNPAAPPGGLHTPTFSGTSSATPLVAGVAALIISVNPRLSGSEVRAIVESTATRIGHGYDARGHSPRFGFGRVDAAAAVLEAKRRR